MPLFGFNLKLFNIYMLYIYIYIRSKYITFNFDLKIDFFINPYIYIYNVNIFNLNNCKIIL